MMHNDDSRTALGMIRVHKNVIASIAFLAAKEIEGVMRIGHGAGMILPSLLKKDSAKAIRVEIDHSGEVKMDVPVIITYGYNIGDISAQIQENVRLALDKMTNLSIKEININIQGIEK